MGLGGDGGFYVGQLSSLNRESRLTSLKPEAVGLSESWVATFRVINTDALGFLRIWDRRTFVKVRRSERGALTTKVVVLYGGLVEILRARRVSFIEVTHAVEVRSCGDHFSRRRGERVAAGWYGRSEWFLAGSLVSSVLQIS